MQNKPETLTFYRRSLPHWHVAGRSHFVTFRLHGTLPASVMKELQLLRLKRQESGNVEDDKRMRYNRNLFRLTEEALDVANPTISHLKIPEVAKLVVDAFCWAENECGWTISSFVVMPNHVHVLFANGESANRSLLKTLASIKSYTATRANKIIGRINQPFWQSESFDHWCRDVDKEESVKRYIRNNPVKAGLVKDWSAWPWVK